MPYAILPKHSPSGHKKVRFITLFHLRCIDRPVLNWDEDKLCCRPQVVTPVVWNKPDIENTVPLWIIILAILAGLLLLALLIYVLYKVSGKETRKNTFLTNCAHFYSLNSLSKKKIKMSPFSLVFHSLTSSSDLYPTARPWRKHSWNHRLPLRPERAAESPQTLAIWLQQRNTMEHEEWITKHWMKEREIERPLELHCAALEDKTKSKDLQIHMNVFFSLIAFFNLYFSAGWDCYQVELFFLFFAFCASLGWRVQWHPFKLPYYFYWCYRYDAFMASWQDKATWSLWQPGAVKVFYFFLLIRPQHVFIDSP